MRACAVITILGLGLLAGSAQADDVRDGVTFDAAVRTPPTRLRRSAPWTRYRPAMPLPESRSAWTAMAVPPTPFGLTSGEALTPPGGSVAVSITRISDERFLIDGRGRRWHSDGEINLVQAEFVSRAIPLRIGRRRLAAHVSASLSAFSLEHGVLENLRNWVEENLLGGDPSTFNHDIGGRRLDIAGRDLLGSAPILKLRIAGKVHLPRARIFGRPLCSAVSLGLTLPAFGWSTSAGNESVQPDLTLAYRLPLSSRWILTGATTVGVPGGTRHLDRLGIATEDVLVGSHLQVEHWFNRHWAAALGFQYQTNYIRGTLLPMDLASTYATLGFQWRPGPCHTLHIIFSENPQGGIPVGAQREFGNSQRESDFALQIGWRYSL